MKLTAGVALLVLALGVAAIAADAQAHSSRRNYDYGFVHRYHHVLGPAYGRPGEPLGPAYWGITGPEQMPNPRSCGPGACQDNPRY